MHCCEEGSEIKILYVIKVLFRIRCKIKIKIMLILVLLLSFPKNYNPQASNSSSKNNGNAKFSTFVYLFVMVTFLYFFFNLSIWFTWKSSHIWSIYFWLAEERLPQPFLSNHLLLSHVLHRTSQVFWFWSTWSFWPK